MGDATAQVLSALTEQALHEKFDRLVESGAYQSGDWEAFLVEVRESAE